MDDLVPIVLFVAIATVFALALYFRFRTRREIQQTVRLALEQGQPLSPEILEGLSASLSSPNADLRRGVISIAVGIAVALFALLVGEPDAEDPLLAIAAFPVVVGLAYLGLWYFLKRPRA